MAREVSIQNPGHQTGVTGCQAWIFVQPSAAGEAVGVKDKESAGRPSVRNFLKAGNLVAGGAIQREQVMGGFRPGIDLCRDVADAGKLQDSPFQVDMGDRYRGSTCAS